MSDEHRFKRGDVVQLMSGGPLLTVASLHPDGMIKVLWLGTDGMLRGHDLPQDLVRQPDAPTTP